MATVTPTAQQGLLAQFMQPAAKKTGIEGVQDRFLKLLVTQLSRQDPLNPMDNAQVTTQMAQISTVTGIEKLNQALSDMSASFTSAQTLQASALVGRGVVAEGSSLVLGADGARGGFELAQGASAVTVTISKPNGEVVKTLQLDPTQGGTHAFGWDGSTDAGGAAAPGVYQFAVKAVDQGKAVDVKTLGYGRVQGVTLGGAALVLDTLGLGALRMDQIKQILQ
jgi:flagellar basal-body rod modification protein FlgD